VIGRLDDAALIVLNRMLSTVLGLADGESYSDVILRLFASAEGRIVPRGG
jgi:hypothetical protein